jgi:regulator of replication initiation timing
MEEAFGLLGAETGKLEKRLREAITADKTLNLRRLDQQRDDLHEAQTAQRKALDETIAAMGRTIANQEARLQSVEAMFAVPTQTPAADRRRLS